MTTDLHLLTITEASRLIAQRELSPVEYTDALLARIGTFDPQLNAFITVTAEVARKQAREAEAEITAGRLRGPLHGIPFALKDIYGTKGILTSGGSKVCKDNLPAADATTTRKLLEVGAVLLGKLQTHEFAHGGPSFDLPWPPSRNPWNLEHFTGGSSSGSGAALAAGLVPAALGSDTGGSIRNPASHCGITGFMPTYGLVSRAGVMPNSFTFDHCGPMARTVEDCAILLQVIAGFDPADAGSTEQEIPDYRAALGGDLEGLRVGVLRHYWEEDAPAHADHKQALEAAIATFGKLGAKLEDCRSRPIHELRDIKVVIAETELFAIHQDELVKNPGNFGRDFLGRVLPACVFQSVDYMQALREHRRYLDEMKPLYEKHDVLLTAGLGPAPRLDASRTLAFWRAASVCTPANVGRNPTLMVPCGFSGTGLPMGLQIVGRPFGDATVLRVGHAYQTATDWHLRRPALVPGAVPPAVNTDANEPGRPDVDAATRSHVEGLAHRAGLKLDERQMAMLLESAPSRWRWLPAVRKPRERAEEPSMVFRFVDR